VRLVGVDEERHARIRVRKLTARGAHRLELAGHVETAFGCQFLTLFGHEANVVRLHLARDVEHFLRDRAFQIHSRLQKRTQRAHVGVHDMSAVFAQMQRDCVSARLFRHQRGANRVRVRGAARVAQRGDVVDIHAEIDHVRRR